MKLLFACMFQVLCVFGHGYEFIRAFASLTGLSPVEAVLLCGSLMIFTIIAGPSLYHWLMKITAMDLPDVELADDSDDEEEPEEEWRSNILHDPEFVRLMLKNHTECTVA